MPRVRDFRQFALSARSGGPLWPQYWCRGLLETLCDREHNTHRDPLSFERANQSKLVGNCC